MNRSFQSYLPTLAALLMAALVASCGASSATQIEAPGHSEEGDHGDHGAEIDAFDIHGVEAIERGLIHFRQGLRPLRHAGIVDQDVQPARQLGCRGNRPPDLGSHGYVRAHRQPAQFHCHAAGQILVQIGNNDTRAFSGEPAGNARAEAGGAAGDQCGLALQSHGADYSPARGERRQKDDAVSGV